MPYSATQQASDLAEECGGFAVRVDFWPFARFARQLLVGRSACVNLHMQRLLLVASAFASAIADTGTYGTNFTAASTRLRAILLEGYDKRTPPSVTRSTTAGTTSQAGTDVLLSVRFFKVQEVKAAEVAEAASAAAAAAQGEALNLKHET